MTKKILTLVLPLFLLGAQAARTARAQTPEQTDPAKVEKTKERAARFSERGYRVEVKLFDGRKLKGHVNSVAADDFVLLDRKAGTATTIRYAQVRELKRARPGVGVAGWVSLGVAVGLIALTPLLAGGA